MILLDLATDLNPVYKRFESYYGQPFIWCMFGNNGGTLELYGDVAMLNQASSKKWQPYKMCLIFSTSIYTIHTYVLLFSLASEFGSVLIKFQYKQLLKMSK